MVPGILNCTGSFILLLKAFLELYCRFCCAAIKLDNDKRNRAPKNNFITVLYKFKRSFLRTSVSIAAYVVLASSDERMTPFTLCSLLSRITAVQECDATKAWHIDVAWHHKNSTYRQLNNKTGAFIFHCFYFYFALVRFYNIITQAWPRPVPCPDGFVVKNGWKILSTILFGIPIPLSLIVMISCATPAALLTRFVETVTMGWYFSPAICFFSKQRRTRCCTNSIARGQYLARPL